VSQLADLMSRQFVLSSDGSSSGKEHWYGNPEVSGSSPGPVNFSLPIFHFFFISASTKF
jgi:hypothetical protein